MLEVGGQGGSCAWEVKGREWAWAGKEGRKKGSCAWEVGGREGAWAGKEGRKKGSCAWGVEGREGAWAGKVDTIFFDVPFGFKWQSTQNAGVPIVGQCWAHAQP